MKKKENRFSDCFNARFCCRFRFSNFCDFAT